MNLANVLDFLLAFSLPPWASTHYELKEEILLPANASCEHHSH